MNNIPAIPDSHMDLLQQPIVVVLATLMPDGQPQVTASGVCMTAHTCASSPGVGLKRKEICAIVRRQRSW